MHKWSWTKDSLPDDIVLKIASFLQVSDLCALGSCSRYWRQLCASDSIWASLCRDRWPSLDFSEKSRVSVIENPRCEEDTENFSSLKGWRGFYIERHFEMADRVTTVVTFVELSSQHESLEVGYYLKAIEDMILMKLGFKDVQMFLFQSKLNVLLNLVGLHYCICWLGVPPAYVMQALRSRQISERQVSVNWWKIGRWFYGFRMRDESHSRRVSLGDLVTTKDGDILKILQRGAVHGVLRIQIFGAT